MSNQDFWVYNVYLIIQYNFPLEKPEILDNCKLYISIQWNFKLHSKKTETVVIDNIDEVFAVVLVGSILTGTLVGGRTYGPVQYAGNLQYSGKVRNTF